MQTFIRLFVLVVTLQLTLGSPAASQEARRRWERMCQIRAEKFDRILPEAMRENGIDMWITMIKEGDFGPLYEDLGRGYAGNDGYYVFTDRGSDRIERAALGVSGYRLERCGVYDIVTGSFDLGDFVRERAPERIGLNMSEQIGAADGLSHTGYLKIQAAIGERYASRIVSAEKLVSDFRSRRTASEIVAFGQAGEMSREIAERAFSNEVITPGLTTLEDVAWWMSDQQLARGLDTSFDMPSVYVTGPEGIVATSSDRVIQRGDLLMIDWGVGYLNFYTDMKRIAYVLREGETDIPAPLRNAMTQAIRARDVVTATIQAGRTAGDTWNLINDRLEEAGFGVIDFNRPTDSDKTEVVVGSHSVGNTGHGIGPSIAFFNPLRMTYEIKPSNLFSIELFAYTANPDWGGAKVRIPLEDDAIVTERGVEWLYPVNDRILVIK